MKTFEVFERRLASMRAQINDKDAEYVRIEVQGLEVVELVKHRNNDETIEIAEFDENNKETVLICPSGHFSARLSFAPKKQQKQQIGFRIDVANGDKQQV